MSFYPALQHYDYQNMFHAQTRVWCESLFLYLRDSLGIFCQTVFQRF